MSSSLYRFGLAAARSPWKVIGAWITVIVLSVGLALAAGTRLDDAFSIPGTESQAGLDALETRFPQLGGTNGQVIFVTRDGSDVTEHRAEIQSVMKDAGTIKGIETATDPFDERMPGEISDDQTAIIANLQLDASLDAVPAATQEAVLDLIKRSESDSLKVYAGGQLMQQTSVPVSFMEVLGVVAALIVLTIAFKALRAAFIPIVTAIAGLIIAMLLTFAGTSLFTISSTAPTLAVMLGLAVGIDYALFIVSRHLDQLREGIDPYESIARSVATSGSAVIFAGLTVIIALVGLFITQIPFLTVMGLVSAIAVGANVIAALTLLPAILGLFGEHIRPAAQRSNRRRAATSSSARVTGKERWVRAITRVPLLTIVIVTVGLGALAYPAKDLGLALPDQGTDAAGTATREAYDVVTDKFGPGYNAVIMISADIVNTTDPLGVLDSLEKEILATDGVEGVQIATPNMGADLGVIVLRPHEGPSAESTQELVQQLRSRASTWESEYNISDVTVTGSTAVAIDITDRLEQALIPFGLFVVGLSLVLLAIVFRSVWVPIKAALGFLLSVGAAFGVTAMVYTYGWGAQLINADVTGPVISFLPIIVMGVLFGLAMDYEFFLVTRMREEYIHGHNARSAIHRGFVTSAPVVTAAGAIMVFIFASFIPESAFMMQPISLALAVGVFVDAFIVRMTLVPAVLALLGDHAWRFPPVLERLLPRVDVEGEGLATVLEHRDFTDKHGRVAVRWKDTVIPAIDGHGSIGPLNGTLAPGTLTLLTGSTHAARASILAAVSGRLSPTSGHIVVYDRHIPGEAQAAQARITRVRAHTTNGIQGLRPDRSPEQLIVVDQASDLTSVGLTERDLLETLLRNGGAIIAGADMPPTDFTRAWGRSDALNVIDLDTALSDTTALAEAHA